MVYILTGTSDDLTAKTLIQNSTATSYDGLVRQSIQIEPEWVGETAGEGQPLTRRTERSSGIALRFVPRRGTTPCQGPLDRHGALRHPAAERGR